VEKCRLYRQQETARLLKMQNAHRNTSTPVPITPFDSGEKPTALRIGRTSNGKGGGITAATYTPAHELFCYAVALLHNVQIWTRLKTKAGDVVTAETFTSSEALLGCQVSAALL
jgi:hypothetical protein